jgi:hypothetical protein
MLQCTCERMSVYSAVSIGGHLVLRACTVFTRCLQDLYISAHLFLFSSFTYGHRATWFLRDPLCPQQYGRLQRHYYRQTSDVLHLDLPFRRCMDQEGNRYSRLATFQQTPYALHLCQYQECCGRLDRNRRQEQARVIWL